MKSINKKKKNLIIAIISILLIGIILLSIYFISSGRRISYKESSNINYKVMLLDNEFYEEEYLEEGNEYISSIINSILITDYDYKMKFSKNIENDYSYQLVAEIDVKDEKNNNSIYHFREILKKDNITNSDDIIISLKDLNIDYQKYNNTINKFKDIYELNDISSKLNINLYITINNINDREVKNYKEKKVSSLVIPLTLNTVNIEKYKDLNKGNKIILSNNNYQKWLLILGLLFIVIGIIMIIYLIKYLHKNRTAQMVYEKEIKSIMRNYDEYIETISDSYDVGTSQVLRIEDFNDLLEIRDTLKQPILRLENDKKDGTFFIIPATNDLIYVYALRVVDIKAKMEGKEIPTYNITEIIMKDFKKHKKFTDKYIKAQITVTTSMPVIDEGNVVSNKNNKDNLYEQLDKTTSFDIKEIKKAAKKKKHKINKKS